MKGRVVKIISFEYYVMDSITSEITPCRGRGKLRLDGDIFVGDKVEFTHDNGKYGVITKVYDRDNCLVRPYVANIDLVVIVLAPLPVADFNLVDRILVNCTKNNITPLICINKCDLGNIDYITQEYKYYDIIKVSAKTGEGIEILRDRLKGKVSCFAGQSAVGKTSIVNALTDSNFATGDLSRILKGRHTTRHVEIHCINADTYVADTCGFTLLELEDIKPNEFRNYYDDFNEVSAGCYFRNCLHIKETNCAVKRAVENNTISKDRYARYVSTYEELLKRYKEKYS